MVAHTAKKNRDVAFTVALALLLAAALASLLLDPSWRPSWLSRAYWELPAGRP